MRAILECRVPENLLALLPQSGHTGPKGLQPSSSRTAGAGLDEVSLCGEVRSRNSVGNLALQKGFPTTSENQEDSPGPLRT